MDPITVAAAVVVARHGLLLLALWLRLRAQQRQASAHRRFLLAAARALPDGGQVHEQRPDGSILTLTATGGRPAGSAHG